MQLDPTPLEKVAPPPPEMLDPLWNLKNDSLIWN